MRRLKNDRKGGLAMKDATLKQGKKAIEFFEKLDAEKMQDILASGLLSDICKGSVAGVDRNKIRELLGLGPLAGQLLSFLGTDEVTGFAEPFVVKEKFVVDTRSEAEVNICEICESFRRIFLNKIEFPCAPFSFRYHKPLSGVSHSQIIECFGGEDVIAVPLYAIFSLMKKYDYSQGGSLTFSDIEINLIPAYDEDSNLWFVSLNYEWKKRGWSIGVPDWHDKMVWISERTRIFSRNPAIY